MPNRFALALACVLATVSVAPALAQDTPSEASADDARIHLGALALDPKIALRDLGIDSNVYNETSSPHQDMTMRLVPAVDAWLRIGRATLSSKSTLSWSYFHRAAEQRSFDFGEEARVEVGLARVVPWIGGSYLQTRQRPNLEIDERVQQDERTLGAGATFNKNERLEFDIDTTDRSLAFGKGEYGDPELAAALDRTELRVNAAVRYGLTPLTTFVVRTTATSSTFDQATVRNSQSLSFVPGFEMQPAALISGKGFLGVKRFTGDDVSLPDFTGLVSEVDVAYLMREFTRLNVRASRDLEYSIEDTHPYFVMTGGEVSVTQGIGTVWDVIGRIGRTRLDYQALVRGTEEGDPVAGPREDRVFTYGMGIGRRLRSEIRIGIDINHVQRSSVLDGHEYSGTRVGASITYGV